MHFSYLNNASIFLSISLLSLFAIPAKTKFFDVQLAGELFEGVQDTCGVIGSIYGGMTENERGYSLVSAEDGVHYFVAGLKGDSVLLVKASVDGTIAWTRTFDIVKNVEDHVSAIVFDEDGMLAIAGTSGDWPSGGSVFVFRYDPDLHQLLWSREYTNAPNNFCFSMIKNNINGNYILSNSAHFTSDPFVDAEVLEVDKVTGNIIPQLANMYHIGGSDDFTEIYFDQNFIYGAGRFTVGAATSAMRACLVKMNSEDGSVAWSKSAHVGLENTARIYGRDLIVDEGFVFTLSHGNPSGTSFNTIKLFIQKTSVDGQLIWINQYELPDNVDIGYEIIKSTDGYVVYAHNRDGEEYLVLFKIDANGVLLWSNEYRFSNAINSTIRHTAKSQLIQVGEHLVFTGYTTDILNNEDLVIVRTDLNGVSTIPCVTSTPSSVTVIPVTEPVLFDQVPSITSVSPQEVNAESTFNESVISVVDECFKPGSTTIEISATICNGENFEGYSLPGVYPDTFDIEGGCDSIRILTLSIIECEQLLYYDLDACRSYMIDGSHMDFSEFTPAYPVILPCTDVDAGTVHMVPSPDNKHSCTPGVNGTVAMCVGVFNTCAYEPGHNSSVVFEMNVSPVTNGEVWITGLEFFEKAPATYNWIEGPSGLNNYPQYYGLRILRDGIEIYRQENVATNVNWNLEAYSFVNDSLFRFNNPGLLRFELFPYCPIGNGAEVSAWDLDAISVFGACGPSSPSASRIYGNVFAMQGQPVEHAKIYLGASPSMHSSNTSWSNADGYYLFDNVNTGKGYYARSTKNDNILEGVSTLDMLMMQKHLLGMESFGSLVQYVSADINNSGHVTAIDILELRKALLGITHEFPFNKSWRIGARQQDFGSSDPTKFIELLNIEYLAASEHQLDFLGIKIGDVNGDIDLSGLSAPTINRTNKSISLSISDQKIEAATPFILDIVAQEDIIAEGVQLSIDVMNMDLIEVKGKSLPIRNEHFSFLHNNELRISWSAAEAKNITKGDILFSIEMVSAGGGYLSELISVNDVVLRPEMYTTFEVKDINLNFEKPARENHTEGFFHVSPNPFNGEARLNFNLTEGGETRILFYTLSGEQIHSINKVYRAGEHMETITPHQLSGATGVIVCHLLSNGFNSVQKIIRLP